MAEGKKRVRKITSEDTDKKEESNTSSTSTPPPISGNPMADFKKSGGDYNPLGGAVVEREYTKPSVTTPPEHIAPIPAPFIQRPVINIAEEMNQKSPNASNIQDTANPALNDLGVEEKRRAAETMVDVALQGYDLVHMGARRLIRISDDKRKNLHEKDGIDFNRKLVVDEKGTQVTVSAFCDNFNNSIDQLIVVEKDFKEKIKPPLTRIAMKRGWGLSDEQEVLFLVIQDVGIKFGLGMNMISSLNTIISALKVEAADIKNNMTPPVMKPAEQPIAPTPQPQAQPAPQPENSIYTETEIISSTPNQTSNLEIMHQPENINKVTEPQLMEPEEKA